MRELYKQTETPEVFSWDPSSNNRGILSGKLSFVQNAISVTRSAEKDNPEMSKQIQLRPALKGPVRRIAAEHVMSCYVIWEFAENKEGAKQFLSDNLDMMVEIMEKIRVSAGISEDGGMIDLTEDVEVEVEALADAEVEA